MAKILAVDDSASMRGMVAFTLRSAGYEVSEAENGQLALDAARGARFDLVLADVNMPVMDGLETLKALKAINPDCVVIMLTSLANRQTIDQAAALGAANYIRKDAPPEEIGRALSDTIESCFEVDEPEESAPPS